MINETTIQALARRIADSLHPHRIVLFGSFARGEAGVASDIDLLVVLPFDGPRYRVAARIRALLPNDIPIDVVVRRPDEVEPGRADVLALDIARHGKTLYQSAA